MVTEHTHIEWGMVCLPDDEHGLARKDTQPFDDEAQGVDLVIGVFHFTTLPQSRMLSSRFDVPLHGVFYQFFIHEHSDQRF